MRLEAGCEIEFEVHEPTPMILMLRPRSGAAQWITSEYYLLDPVSPVIEYVDGYGNLCQRLVAQPGPFKVAAGVTVDTVGEIDVAPGTPPTPVELVPDDLLQFLLPSRYCEADRVCDLACEITGQALPGYDQIEAIRSWIATQVEYRYGASHASTSALDTIRDRSGVCRDFAHLGIALSRSLNIPARMVVGYLHELDPMDLHAWFEAYVGGRWYTFDATQKEPRGGRIVIAYGRDAADVALATQFGPATLTTMRVSVRQQPDGAGVTGHP